MVRANGRKDQMREVAHSSLGVVRHGGERPERRAEGGKATGRSHDADGRRVLCGLYAPELALPTTPAFETGRPLTVCGPTPEGAAEGAGVRPSADARTGRVWSGRWGDDLAESEPEVSEGDWSRRVCARARSGGSKAGEGDVVRQSPVRLGPPFDCAAGHRMTGRGATHELALWRAVRMLPVGAAARAVAARAAAVRVLPALSSRTGRASPSDEPPAEHANDKEAEHAADDGAGDDGRRRVAVFVVGGRGREDHPARKRSRGEGGHDRLGDGRGEA